MSSGGKKHYLLEGNDDITTTSRGRPAENSFKLTINFLESNVGHAHNFKVLIPPFDILTMPGLSVTV